MAALQGFAGNPASNCLGYHCYEVVLAYAAVVDAGVQDPFNKNATLLALFKTKLGKGIQSQVGHQAKVENHGIDAAIQQVYGAKIFPDLHQSSWDAIPKQMLQNWLHGHALDESAINYDGISIVRLVKFLELMPGGLDDLHSDAFKSFVIEFADALTPAGCLSNHGGGLQDDGQGHCNGAYLFTFFFEYAATMFQHSDPDAASYFKWAARSMFRGLFPKDDFGSFYWTPVRAYVQEQLQLGSSNAGSSTQLLQQRTPIPIPDLVDLQSKVIYKNEYGHAADHVDAGIVPKKVVICPSRSKGSAYVQSDVYQCPPGYHGAGMQAGMMNHYEYGEHLFIYGGPQTKHTSQSDADTGLPILMPFSVAADNIFPWRWGQHNMAPGTWQRTDKTTLMMVGATQESGNWDDWWGNQMQNLAITCNAKPVGGPTAPEKFDLYIDSVSLVAANGAERVLDNFEYWKSEPSAWGEGSSWSTLTADNRTGGRSLMIQCDPNRKRSHSGGDGQVIVNRPINATPTNTFHFRNDDYPYFRVKFMVGDTFVPNSTFGYSTQSGGYAAANYLDIGIPFRVSPLTTAPTNDFIANFTNVVAETKTFDQQHNDSHGGWNATSFGGWTRETSWTRHVTLLEDGVMVVLDSLQTSEQQGGWLGGPLWQMKLASNCSGNVNVTVCNMSKPQLPGGDWFDLRGFELTTNFIDVVAGRLPESLNLVAKFGGASGTEYGSSPGWQAMPYCQNKECVWENPVLHDNHPQPWFGAPWQTFWSKRRIASSSRALFASVFVPYKVALGEGASAAIASKIQIETDDAAGTTVVNLVLPESNTPATISMDVMGKWHIIRS